MAIYTVAIAQSIGEFGTLQPIHKSLIQQAFLLYSFLLSKAGSLPCAFLPKYYWAAIFNYQTFCYMVASSMICRKILAQQ